MRLLSSHSLFSALHELAPAGLCEAMSALHDIIALRTKTKPEFYIRALRAAINFAVYSEYGIFHEYTLSDPVGRVL